MLASTMFIRRATTQRSSSQMLLTRKVSIIGPIPKTAMMALSSSCSSRIISSSSSEAAAASSTVTADGSTRTSSLAAMAMAAAAAAATMTTTMMALCEKKNLNLKDPKTIYFKDDIHDDPDDDCNMEDPDYDDDGQPQQQVLPASHALEMIMHQQQQPDVAPPAPPVTNNNNNGPIGTSPSKESYNPVPTSKSTSPLPPPPTRPIHQPPTSTLQQGQKHVTAHTITESIPTHAGLTLAEERLEEQAQKARKHAGGLKLFSGNGNMTLALEIAKILGINLGRATVGRFADGEVNVMIHENVRGKDVYIIQPTCPPVNENLMELLLMVSTLNRASARRITVVIPYYGYARQDRKMQARVPISAADVARLLEAMGIDRVIAVDLHCGQIQGFFGPRVPVDNLDGGIVGINHFGDKDLHNPVIVSPDAGGVYRAKKFKEGLSHKFGIDDIGLAMIIKQRARAGTVDQMDLVGDVTGCDCVIVDDMIDTAGTLCKAAEVLKAKGARRVFAFASHGLLSGPGNSRIANSEMEECVILNTIPSTPQREANEKLTELSVAPLLAQTIFNIHAKKSISALFK